MRSSSPSRRSGVAVSPEPVSGGYSIENVEEGACGDVVAFVDDNETVVSGELFDVVAAGQCGQQCDVDDAGGLGSPTSDLSALESEVLVQPVTPLVRQGFAVDQDECRRGTGSDGGAGDHRLAGAGRCDQHAGIFVDELAGGAGLLGPERG